MFRYERVKRNVFRRCLKTSSDCAAVTSPADEHHRPLASTKLYYLVTEAHVCKQLAQGCTRLRGGRDSNPQPADRKSVSLNTRPLSHTTNLVNNQQTLNVMIYRAWFWNQEAISSSLAASADFILCHSDSETYSNFVDSHKLIRRAAWMRSFYSGFYNFKIYVSYDSNYVLSPFSSLRCGGPTGACTCI